MAGGRVWAVAQLGERLVCNQEATGSIPVSSTKISYQVLGLRALRFSCDLTPKTCDLNLMLGVNATTESVSRLEKVAWRRTLGW